MKIEAKLWPLEDEQCLYAIWSSNLVINWAWLILESDQEMIHTNILV